MAASKATIKGDRVTLPHAKLTVRAVDPDSKVFSALMVLNTISAHVLSPML